jgi:uncharacterized protein
MRQLSLRFVVAVLFVCGPFAAAAGAAETAAAAAPTSPEALARQLIRVTGGGELGKQVLEQLIDAFRGAHPDVPDAFWTEFLSSVDAGQLEELAIPVYVKNLTSDEMSAAIAFYESPTGQSLVRKLPAIMQESMAAGQEWGASIGRQAMQRLMEYKDSQPDGAAPGAAAKPE